VPPATLEAEAGGYQVPASLGKVRQILSQKENKKQWGCACISHGEHLPMFWSQSLVVKKIKVEGQ
jgi:hypothetical protein